MVGGGESGGGGLRRVPERLKKQEISVHQKLSGHKGLILQHFSAYILEVNRAFVLVGIFTSSLMCFYTSSPQAYRADQAFVFVSISTICLMYFNISAPKHVKLSRHSLCKHFHGLSVLLHYFGPPRILSQPSIRSRGISTGCLFYLSFWPL